MVVMVLWKLILALPLLAPSEACNILSGSGLTCDDIVSILDYHNEMRNRVALKETNVPGAKNMSALKWNDELAKISQDYANQCTFKHNKNRPENTGENIASHIDTQEGVWSAKKLAADWYNKEVDKYTYPNPSSEDTGHYTQLIWASTLSVGCGLSYFKEGDKYKTMLVCDYQPPGNYKDQPPFVEFREGTIRCDNGLVHSKYAGLCAQDKEQQEDKYVPCSGRTVNILSLPHYIGIYCLMLCVKGI